MFEITSHTFLFPSWIYYISFYIFIYFSAFFIFQINSKALSSIPKSSKIPIKILRFQKLISIYFISTSISATNEVFPRILACFFTLFIFQINSTILSSIFPNHPNCKSNAIRKINSDSPGLPFYFLRNPLVPSRQFCSATFRWQKVVHIRHQPAIWYSRQEFW